MEGELRDQFQWEGGEEVAGGERELERMAFQRVKTPQTALIPGKEEFFDVKL